MSHPNPAPHAPFRDGRPLFSTALLPYLRHPEIEARGPATRDELLRRALIRYLHGTSVLEVQVVNRVAAALAHREVPWALDAQSRHEALQLYVDEAHHALECSELLLSLGAGDFDGAPAFVERLEALVARAPEPTTARFLFAFVTETSISRQLALLSRDRRIAGTVRRFVADHAADEARHHRLFAGLFASFWRQRSRAARGAALELLPALIEAYLSPDLAGVEADLVAAGIAGAGARRVLEETYRPEAVGALVRDGARPVLAALRRVGPELSRAVEGELEREGRA